MNVFVAGATGAIGKQLIPLLVAGGHEVTGMTRSSGKQSLLRQQGARPVVANALDPDAVAEAVAHAEPDVIIQALTSLAGPFNLRQAERFLAETSLLRTRGTDHLLAAARAIGVKRYISESYTGWPFARTGGLVKTEDDPLDPDPPRGLRKALDAIKYLEKSVTEIQWAEGLVLRNGFFYGPGTGISLDPGAEMVAPLYRRQFPIIGGGGGVWSFVHIADAAAAVVAAVERGSAGIYQIADDEPAPVRKWLPELAVAVGAPAPRSVPRWLGRIIGGEVATVMMTEIRGASNARARNELGWIPHFTTWRDGFRSGLE